MSFAALLVRLIQDADGFQILFYRGFPQCLMVMIVACFIRQISIKDFFKTIDKTDIYLGFTMCIAFSFYIFALLNTSVASALFILSIAPVFAALLSWYLIGEIPTNRTWISILCALIGVTIMVGADLTSGRLLGNLFAMISALSFALMLVMARKSRKSDVLTGNSYKRFMAIFYVRCFHYWYRNCFCCLGCTIFTSTKCWCPRIDWKCLSSYMGLAVSRHANEISGNNRWNDNFLCSLNLINF